MTDLHIGVDGSWVEVRYWVPFRKCYFYWDKSNFLIGKVSGARIIMTFIHKDYPYLGCFLTCWSKDSRKIEKRLDLVNKKLKKDDEYEKFISMWHQNLLELRRSKK